MKTCKKCLYTESHALNIIFDKDGVCSGCRVHEEKDTLNWTDRENKLLTILNYYRGKSNKNYDCIVPVSGGKDSYFIIDLVKNKYKMNPLLVSYNKQYNTKIGIRNLQYLKTIFQCDCIESTINPLFSKKLTRHTLEKFGSIYWHNHLGSTTFPVQVAVNLKIPLIIWGVHQGVDQVGMFSHTDEVEMTRKYRKEHDLMGYEAEDVISEKNGIFERDMAKHFYPSNKDIETIGVRGIYLSNYVRWDSKLQHELMIKKYNYETLVQTRTFNPYDNVDCFMYSDLHDYIKYIKHGYSKITDHVSREIRLKHLSRDQGKILVQYFEKIQPKHVEKFLDWSGLSKENLTNLLKKFSKYPMADDSYNDENKMIIKSFKDIYKHNNKEIISDDEFILFDKGFVNKIKGN
jgi:N-acetyl sugar amidotransferase